MSATLELYGRWKAAKRHETDSAALAALGLSRAAAAHWKNGREAGAEIIERMAIEIGESPGLWAAKAMAGSSKGETARAWERIARGLATGVLGVAVALPLMPSYAGGMHIMSTRRRPMDGLSARH